MELAVAQFLGDVSIGDDEAGVPKRLKPGIGPVRDFTLRCFCSTMLFR